MQARSNPSLVSRLDTGALVKQPTTGSGRDRFAGEKSCSNRIIVRGKRLLFGFARITLADHVVVLHENQCIGVKAEVLCLLNQGSHHGF